MTTYELMREGEWSHDGRMITPGTLTWREDVIPLLGYEKERLGAIVGAVRNLRREGNKILGDTDEVPAGKVLTVDCDNYDQAKAREVAPGRIEMSDLRIRAAHISDPEQYPWDTNT